MPLKPKRGRPRIGSMTREQAIGILERRLRDPETPAANLAGIAKVLAQLKGWTPAEIDVTKGNSLADLLAQWSSEDAETSQVTGDG